MHPPCRKLADVLWPRPLPPQPSRPLPGSRVSKLFLDWFWPPDDSDSDDAPLASRALGFGCSPSAAPDLEGGEGSRSPAMEQLPRVPDGPLDRVQATAARGPSRYQWISLSEPCAEFKLVLRELEAGGASGSGGSSRERGTAPTPAWYPCRLP